VQAVSEGAGIAPPAYRGARGHPVGFSRKFFDELAALHGDQGARELLQRHAQSLIVRDTDDPGVLRDIDRPSDLEQAPASV